MIYGNPAIGATRMRQTMCDAPGKRYWANGRVITDKRVCTIVNLFRNPAMDTTRMRQMTYFASKMCVACCGSIARLIWTGHSLTCSSSNAGLILTGHFLVCSGSNARLVRTGHCLPCSGDIARLIRTRHFLVCSDTF